MANFIRYALASVCFAASVGCLALWWRSMTCWDRVSVTLSTNKQVHISTFFERCRLDFSPPAVGRLSHWSQAIGPEFKKHFDQPPAFRVFEQEGRLHVVWFPIWYACLIFALAGVAALRLSRFTLRSAIIATTVVAGLLGMAVSL